MKTILVIDDEPELVRALRGYLEQSGYRVVTASNGKTGLAAFHNERPDLVLLDLMLPEMDGLEVCRRLRQTSDVPIIMLTARVEEADRVVGLEMGADDYVLKPFSPREVVARVRALLRRVEGQVVAGPDVVRAGDLMLDLARHKATLGNHPLDLTPTEFDLLATLAAEPGRTFTRQQLIDALDADYAISDRTVDSHIKNLRAKIEPDPRQPRYILTIYGVGYKLSEQL
jgi:two-component system alkaline phosphatase synthesis response regulator PhoP